MDIFVEITTEDNKYSFKEKLDESYVDSIVEYGEDYFIDESEYYRLLTTTIDEIKQYNGSHFIFGYIEALMQSHIFPHEAFRDYDNLIIKTSIEE